MRWVNGFALAIVVGLAACGGDSTAPTSTSIIGTYTLRTVNGSALPAVLQQSGGVTISVTDDEFTLNGDHSYSEVGHLKATSATTTTTQLEQDQGVYSYANGAITLTSSIGQGIATGAIAGSQLTIQSNGSTMVYSR